MSGTQRGRAQSSYTWICTHQGVVLQVCYRTSTAGVMEVRETQSLPVYVVDQNSQNLGWQAIMKAMNCDQNNYLARSVTSSACPQPFGSKFQDQLQPLTHSWDCAELIQQARLPWLTVRRCVSLVSTRSLV